MDGNGRWAAQRGFPRAFGHRNGARVVRDVVERCIARDVACLTLYSFSVENWKRPEDEIAALMELCLTYLDGERDQMIAEGIRLVVIGRRDGLPAPVRDAINRVTAATARGTRFTLCLALNYGGRAELVDAARALAADAASGRIAPADIDENAIASRLGTAGLPDPDLLIRTGGEMRISNFLLWQISYAELVFVPTFWPDFTAADLDAAISEFSRRQRRFGAADAQPPQGGA